jgi:hypothetical protein
MKGEEKMTFSSKLTHINEEMNQTRNNNTALAIKNIEPNITMKETYVSQFKIISP